MADMTLAQLQALVEQQGAALAKLKAAVQAETPAPTEYYTLAKTGEEIDEILAGGGGVADAVRYGAVQNLMNAQKLRARRNIGAAPSGGGVLESAQEITASSANESYDTFCAKLDEVLATMAANSVKFLRVYPSQYYGYGSDMCALFKSSNDYASVYTIGSYNINRQGFRMVKRKLYSSNPSGQWDPVEYINPDMRLGVEYRTTERYQGKPVYCKLVNFGALPNNTTKAVAHGAENISLVISVSGESNGENLIGNMYVTYVHVGASNITIKTNADRSGVTASVLIKYTKTTD